MNKNIGVNLSEGSVSKNLAFLVIPMLLGNFLNVGYSIVDSIWIGQIVGSAGLAAVAVSFPILLILISIASGITIAGNILVSQYYGAKDNESLIHVSRVASTLSAFTSIILMVLAYIFSGDLLRLLNTPETVFDLALGYFRISLLGFPFLFYYFLASSLLRGVGDTVRPLIFLAISSILNIILDPILIKGMFGFPKMGLDGAAIATIFSQFVAVVISVSYLKIKDSIIRVNPFRVVFDYQMIKAMFKIGLPFATMQLIVSAGWMFLTSLINTYGEAASAAVGVASKIESISLMALIALSTGIATMSAQNIGANRMDRVSIIYKEGLKLAIGVSSIIALLCIVFSDSIIAMFTKDPLVIEYTKSYIYIVMPSLIALSVMFATNGIINGAGKTFTLMVFAFISLIIIRIPLSYIFSEHFGVAGIWMSMGFSCFVSATLSVTYYISKKWQKGSRIVISEA